VPNTKEVYRFHPATRIYLGADLADESPLEPGVWLVPANATEIQPPEIPPGFVAKFATNYWALEQRNTAERARELALQRLAAHAAGASTAFAHREHALAAYIEGLGDNEAALDAFDPAAMWDRQ
jgi:hypothetical protein